MARSEVFQFGGRGNGASASGERGFQADLGFGDHFEFGSSRPDLGGGRGQPLGTLADDAASLFEGSRGQFNFLDNDSPNRALVVHSFLWSDQALVFGELQEVMTDGGRAAQLMVSESGMLSVDASGGDFDSLAVGEADQVTLTYVAGTKGKAFGAAEISVSVVGQNDAPEALAVELNTQEGEVAVTVGPLGSDVDSDDDGSTLTYHLLEEPAEGAAWFNDGGSFTFDPGDDFQDLETGESRTVTFVYEAVDSHGASSGEYEIVVHVSGVSEDSEAPVPLEPINVLVVYADIDSDAERIAVALEGLDDIASVDLVSSLYGTPDLDLLNGYDAVLTYTDYRPYNPAALGDVLADYVDGGGGVVMAAYSFSEPWAVSGGIRESGYSPFTVGVKGEVSGDFVPVVADDPVFDGVDTETFSGSFYTNANYAHPGLDEGAELLATDGAGHVMMARNESGSVIGLNLYPGYDSPPDGDYWELFANSLAYVSEPDYFA